MVELHFDRAATCRSHVLPTYRGTWVDGDGASSTPITSIDECCGFIRGESLSAFPAGGVQDRFWVPAPAGTKKGNSFLKPPPGVAL